MLLSIIIPIYNEQENIPLLRDRLVEAMEAILHGRFLR